MRSRDMSAQSEAAVLFEEAPKAGRDSLDRLLPEVYEELRAIAHRHLAAHGHAGSLATTGLVHEAYLKLVDQSRAEWRDRAHFLALASVAMRHLLVDEARSRAALKRGGARTRVTLDEGTIVVDDCAETLLAIDDALGRLAAVEPRLAKVVECRFFGGLSEKETAEALGITERTVARDWIKARVLLRRALAA
jgi:RNA polymerase sigma factor (TIGR02999 family)